MAMEQPQGRWCEQHGDRAMVRMQVPEGMVAVRRRPHGSKRELIESSAKNAPISHDGSEEKLNCSLYIDVVQNNLSKQSTFSTGKANDTIQPGQSSSTASPRNLSY